MGPVWPAFAAGLVGISWGVLLIAFRSRLAGFMDEWFRRVYGKWRERIWGDASITPAAIALTGCGFIAFGIYGASVALFAPQAFR